jgi:hypothetical protein
VDEVARDPEASVAIEGRIMPFDSGAWSRAAGTVLRDQALREAEKGGKDQSRLLRNLDSKQRRALTVFQRSREIAAKDVADLFRL